MQIFFFAMQLSMSHNLGKAWVYTMCSKEMVWEFYLRHGSTVEPRYNEDLVTMKITLL